MFHKLHFLQPFVWPRTGRSPCWSGLGRIVEGTVRILRELGYSSSSGLRKQVVVFTQCPAPRACLCLVPGCSPTSRVDVILVDCLAAGQTAGLRGLLPAVQRISHCFSSLCLVSKFTTLAFFFFFKVLFFDSAVTWLLLGTTTHI